MTNKELTEALRRLRVETGSLACFGCGHEHNCSLHGCAVIRAASERLNQITQITRERDAAVKQLSLMCDCDTCKHNNPCGHDDPRCTACTTGQLWAWDGGKEEMQI